MPVKIYNRTFKSFGSAVKFIQETLDLSKQEARAYVAAVDRKQNGKQNIKQEAETNE